MCMIVLFITFLSLETTQMPINRQIYKENVDDPHKGILHSSEKGIDP